MRSLVFSGILFSMLNLLGGQANAQSADYDPLRDDPGLLGRHFLEAQYLAIRSPSEFRPVDDYITGYSTSLNVPTGWNDKLPENMGQDFFVSMMTMGFEGDADLGAGMMNFDAEIRSFNAGVNSYLYLTEDIRPFVQTGISHDVVNIDVSSALINFSDTDIETRFVINPGVEIDLTSQIAWRSVLELDTDETFDSSLYRSELIVWPKSWLYIRGGVIGDTEGESVGGILGAGLAW